MRENEYTNERSIYPGGNTGRSGDPRSCGRGKHAACSPVFAGSGEVREGRERLTLLRGMRLRAVSGELEDRGREDAVSWESGRFDFPGQDGLPQGYSCRKIVLLPGEKAARGSGDGREQIVLYVPDGMFAGGKQQ